MGFEYSDNAKAVVDALKGQNSATASPNLSASMTTGFNSDNIISGNPEEISLRADQYPAIFVRLSDKAEDFAGIGPTGGTGPTARKEATVNYDVFALYRKDGAWTQNTDLLDECYLMARNIENVLRDKYTLGGTAAWAQTGRTDFIGPGENNGIWIQGVRVQLTAKYYFK